MRVVSGKYKGKRFAPPKNFPSRPTTDFAKEALFNILVNRFDFEDLSVLDLFAGTGSISLEFLSRDAKQVTSIDNHAVSVKFLGKMSDELKDPNWSVLKKDCFEFLRSNNTKYDLIFADPPFELKGISEIPGLVFSRNLLNENGLLIIEHGRENKFEAVTQFTEMRNYGGVQFSFFEL